jgi:hypothetical protein
MATYKSSYFDISLRIFCGSSCHTTLPILNPVEGSGNGSCTAVMLSNSVFGPQNAFRISFESHGLTVTLFLLF